MFCDDDDLFCIFHEGISNSFPYFILFLETLDLDYDFIVKVIIFISFISCSVVLMPRILWSWVGSFGFLIRWFLSWGSGNFMSFLLFLQRELILFDVGLLQVGIAIFFWLFFRILQSSFFLFKNFRFSGNFKSFSDGFYLVAHLVIVCVWFSNDPFCCLSDIKEAVTRFCLISDSVSQI